MNDATVLLPHIKLNLNIAYPSFEESYVFGYECAKAELSEQDNPYQEDTNNSNAWLEGWWDGFYGNEPAVSLMEDEVLLTPSTEKAANDNTYHAIESFIESHADFFEKFIKISSALVATVVVGYQVLELVA